MVSGALRGEAAGRTGLVRFEEHDGDNTLLAVPTNATEFLDHVQSTICLLLPDHLMHASSKEGRQEKTQSSPRPFEMELAGRQNGVRQHLASNCTVKSSCNCRPFDACPHLLSSPATPDVKNRTAEEGVQWINLLRCPCCERQLMCGLASLLLAFWSHDGVHDRSLLRS